MIKKTAVFLFCIIFLNLSADNNYFNNGVSLFNGKDYAKAIDAFQKALEETPLKSSIDYYLGISFYREKMHQEAAFHLSRYLSDSGSKELQPFRESISTLFRIYRSEREWEKIIAAGTTALKQIEARKTYGSLKPMVNNAVSSAYLSSGNTALREKKYNQAKACFNKAFYFNPANVNTLENLGRTDYFLGLYEEAEQHFSAFMESAVKNWRPISSSAYYLTQMEADTDAMAKKVQERNPLSASMLKIYGLFHKGSYKEGFAAIGKLEEPVDTKEAIAKDIVSKMQKETSSPEELYLQFISCYPLSSQAEWMLRRILNIIKNNEDAEEIKNRLGQLIKNIVEDKNHASGKKAELEKLLIDIKAGSHTEETEDFLRGILAGYSAIAEKYPGSETAKSVLYEMAMIYAGKLYEENNAVDILIKLSEKGNYKNSAVELAKIYSRQGNYQKVAEIMENLLGKQPGNHEAKMLLGEALLSAGEYDKGIKTLKELQVETNRHNIKNRVGAVLNDYREIKFGKEGLLDDFIHIVLTDTETCFSSSLNIDESFPVFGQHTTSLNIYPFSQDRAPFPFSFEIASTAKPSLTEPNTVYRMRNNKYCIEWNGETLSAPDRWRQKKPFRIIYPWEERSPEKIKVLRTSRFEGKNIVAEIEVFLPSENWEIQISNPAYGKTMRKAIPAPDISADTFISYFTEKEQHAKIILVYAEKPGIEYYYPEIVVSKKEKSDGVIIKANPDAMLTEDIALRTGKPVKNIVLSREKEIIFSLSEQIEQK